ncbi:hypothetical protein C8R47DRAFT_1863 [Mycena vitilis]|nr:hypothetical protein C8R47DRAFT_1863 [Mycena vitilis]
MSECGRSPPVLPLAPALWEMPNALDTIPPPLDRMALATEFCAPVCYSALTQIAREVLLQAQSDAPSCEIRVRSAREDRSKATLRLVQDGRSRASRLTQRRGRNRRVRRVASGRAAGRLLRLWGQQPRCPLPRSHRELAGRWRAAPAHDHAGLWSPYVRLKLREKVSQIYRKMGLRFVHCRERSVCLVQRVPSPDPRPLRMRGGRSLNTAPRGPRPRRTTRTQAGVDTGAR